MQRPVVTVWDKTFARRGWVGDPLAVSVTERHNLPGTAEVVVRSDHHRIPHLLTPGCRLTIDDGDRRAISGFVTSVRGKGPASSGTVTVGVTGDLALLWWVRGWPVPGAAIGAQSVAYDVRTGDAETVLKGFVTANVVTRLGLPVTVATNANRGAAITVQSRFHPLAERLFPAVETAGLGVSAVQDDAAGTIVLDVYEPSTYPRALTEASGVVQGWEYSRLAPTATRVVAGDQGEAEARSFTQSIDAALEAAWGFKVEAFRDARDTDDPTEIAQRRAETLADGATQAGLALTLSETAAFRYGSTVRVGDVVPLEVGPNVVLTDVLREATTSWTAADGRLVTPVVGELTSDATGQLVKAVAQIARAVKNLAVGR